MEDIIDQLREQRLQQPCSAISSSHSAPPKRYRSAYTSIYRRLRLGLPGSIVLMLAAICLAPLSAHGTGYIICYIIVQAITVMRVLIAIQMNITLNHINPSYSVSEVAEYIERLELIHQWDRRYTLYVKVPLTICVIALLMLLLGLDLFAVRWVVYLWMALVVILVPLNFIVAYHSFRKLEKNIENLKNEIQ